MTETKIPKQWYVVVSGWLDAYLTNFTTMEDPSLKRMEGEGGQLAKLTSSSFAGLSDYEEVLSEARRCVQLIAGAMHIKQDPGPLNIVNVVGVFDDGTTEKNPPHGRPIKITSGIPTMTGWNRGAAPRETFEQSVVLFARRSDNPLVADVLRFLSLSPDWFGLYKALEVVRYDLNKVGGKRAGDEFIVANRWATEDELEKFKTTADHHRHWKRREPLILMNLDDARRLVGHIITNWVVDVHRRYVSS
jgi:hypothetical protein